MSLNYIEIKIQPSSFITSRGILKEITIKVKADGKEYTLTELLSESDFESKFDWMMERAKREIKTIILADRDVEEKKNGTSERSNIRP